MLNALVASARKVRVERPGSWKFRETARSTTLNPGPSSRLRGELPSVAWPVTTGFCTNAAVLNQRSGVGSSISGSPICRARSVVWPSRLASTLPLVMVNGRPLRSLMIGAMLQPLSSPRQKPLSPS